MKIPAYVISEETNTIELLKLYIEEQGNFEFNLGFSDFNEAYNATVMSEKMLVVVDISSYQEQGLNFVAKITSENPLCKVITLSDKPDVDLVVRTMRVGTSDFTSMPIIKTEFFKMLEKLYCSFSGEKHKSSNCRVISIYSNKGGIGKTSIATNLAVELSKITKENVALIDLNFQLGDVTTFLDLKPSFNISYMLQNLDKINSAYLLSTLEKYKETSLYILADPPYFKQSDSVTFANIEKLFSILRQTFSYIVVDTSGGFDSKALKALEISDVIFLVMITNLPAIRNCQRCLELFDKMGFDKDKIQILLNRYMENDEITVEDVEKALGRSVYWKIPNNYFNMMSAINKGVPVSLVNPDSNVALSYKNLALNISDSAYRQRK